MLVDNPEDLDVLIKFSNIAEYSKNYKKKTSSNLQNYYTDGPNNDSGSNYITNLITNLESFKYETSITGVTQGNNDTNILL